MSHEFFESGAQTGVMERVRKKISGDAFRKLRDTLRLTQAELAKALGLTTTRISHIEQADKASVYPRVWRKMVELTGKSLMELEAILLVPEPFDLNVEPYSEVEVPEIPLFDLPIAAGVMTPLPTVEEYEQGQALAMKLKRYRVRIRGRSMEKQYPDGCIVEFVCLEWREGKTPLEVGKDYYVQTAEAMTFKRLAKISDEELIFKAINKKEFPDEIRVNQDDVNRIARAVGIFNPV